MLENNKESHDLKNELLYTAEIDQKMRNSNSHDSEIDRKNTKRMKEIIDKYGWPTISTVGEAASTAAWLIAQHADEDINFQEYCYKLMKEQPREEVQQKNIAFLQDRILVHKGLSQSFGTQFYENENGTLVPFPIENEESVNARRKSVGLSTLEEYIELMNRKD